MSETTQRELDLVFVFAVGAVLGAVGTTIMIWVGHLL